MTRIAKLRPRLVVVVVLFYLGLQALFGVSGVLATEVQDSAANVQDSATNVADSAGLARWWPVIVVGVLLPVLVVVILRRRSAGKIDVEAYLLINKGELSGSRHRIARRRTKIGAQEDNDLILPDDRISRHHLLVSYEGGGFVAVDLNSLYGTFTNGKRIERQELVEGTKVNLADAVELEFSRKI